MRVFGKVLILAICLTLIPFSEALADEDAVVRASISTTGTEGDYSSMHAKISGDGQFVVFQSSASTLVSNDTNNKEDVFLYDIQTETVTRISVGMGGVEANGHSDKASISDDGCVVAFESGADNLVANDTNARDDIFVYDCTTSTITRVSVDAAGVEADSGASTPSISGDGQFVAYMSGSTNLVPNDTNDEIDIFLHNRSSGSVQRVSVATNGDEANWSSYSPSVTNNGTFVVFHSLASNLVPNDTNGRTDVFIYDLSNSVIERISVDSNETQGVGGPSFSFDGSAWAAVSADGRYVSFLSHFTNLVANDTNGFADTFVRDRVAGTTVRVSIDSAGNQQNNSSYFDSAISDDGRFVAFTSAASNLVAGDSNGYWDIFVYDFNTGTIERASVDSSGVESNGSSTKVSLSSNGYSVAFNSSATNLVPNDTNAKGDVFIRNLSPALVMPQMIAPNNTSSNTSPVFEWMAVTGATEYELVVYNADTNAVELVNSYPATSAGCSDGITNCTLQPAGLVLTPGDYTWLVRALNGFCAGPWAVHSP